MTNILAPTVLRRLSRYQASLEGATQAVKAAEQVALNLQEQYRMAVQAAIEDGGIETPTDGVQRTLEINWITGEVTFPEVPQNGVVQ